jgi:glycosyl transferase family 25
MRAYVISLHGEDHPRNAELFQVLQRNSILPSLIRAINGKTLAAATYFSLVQCYLWSNQRLLTPSELGCALSHKKAYEELLKTPDDCALFLEDDALLSDSACRDVLHLVEVGLHNKGYVHLGGFEGDRPRCYRHIRGIVVLDEPKTFWIPPCELDTLTGTVGYVASRWIASMLRDSLAENPHIVDNFDYVYQRFPKFRLYYSNIVGHPTNFTASSIEQERLSIRSLGGNGENIWSVTAALKRSFLFRKRRVVQTIERRARRYQTQLVFTPDN